MILEEILKQSADRKSQQQFQIFMNVSATCQIDVEVTYITAEVNVESSGVVIDFLTFLLAIS